jgi:nitrogen fixation NifU-like protein
MELEQLYQEIILDHYRSPHHHGLREPFDAEVHSVNPTCGDEVTLRVSLSGSAGSAESADLADSVEAAEPTVRDVSYDALGCSISQASVSVLADLVIDRPVSQALERIAAFESMVTSRGADPGDEDVLGDGVAFAGVSRYPNRVKCALMGWVAFRQAARQAMVIDGVRSGQ